MNAIFTVLTFLFVISFTSAQSVSNEQIEAMLNGGKAAPTQLAQNNNTSGNQHQVSNSQLENMLNSKSATTRSDSGLNPNAITIEAYRENLGTCDKSNEGYGMKVRNTDIFFRCLKGEWTLISK